jgi:hypothetical protein
MLNRILGCLGGGVCGVALSLAAFYVCALFQFNIIWVGFVSMASLLLFSGLGLLLHRYFSCFLFHIFNAFANAVGDEHSNDGFSGRQWLAAACLILALTALSVGALFQIHVMFAVGTLMFTYYAMFARRVSRGRKG